MSVVVVGRDGYRTIRSILACLAEQTIAGQLEIVPVLPVAEEPDLPDGVATAFHSIVPVVAGKISNRGAASAKGAEKASAPIIAFSENHCFPDADWAERLLSHFGDPAISGVAPVVGNGNPGWGLSWACYATGYANYATDAVKDVEIMPRHNSAYRGDELRKRANRLEDLLRDEGAFQREILDDGGRLIMVPDARSWHLNEGTWYLTLGLNYANGCSYGASQASRFGLPERIARALAFPLAAIPVYRSNMRRLDSVGGRKHMNAELRLGLIAMSLAHAAGEAVAYLGGAPRDSRFIEEESYMVTERLGGRKLSDPRLSRFVALATKETP